MEFIQIEQWSLQRRTLVRVNKIFFDNNKIFWWGNNGKVPNIYLSQNMWGVNQSTFMFFLN